MRKINQKECINVYFSYGPGIFNEHFWYPEIDGQEIYNGLNDKIVDIQRSLAHAVQNFSHPERKELIFDTDNCPYLHIDFTEPTFKED